MPAGAARSSCRSANRTGTFRRPGRRRCSRPRAPRDDGRAQENHVVEVRPAFAAPPVDVVRDEPTTLGAGRELAASPVVLGEQPALPDGRVPHRASEIDRTATTVRHDDDGGLAHPTQRRRGSSGCPSGERKGALPGTARTRSPGSPTVRVSARPEGRWSRASRSAWRTTAAARRHGDPTPDGHEGLRDQHEGVGVRA